MKNDFDLGQNVDDLESAPILMEETLELIREFQFSPFQRQGELLRGEVSAFLVDPGRIRLLLHNFSMVDIAEPELRAGPIQRRLIQAIENTVREAIPEIWTPNKVGRLVNAKLSSPEIYTTEVERIESALFNSPKTVEQSIDFFYNAAWSMVATPRSDIRRELFSVLTFQKDWLKPESLSSTNLMAGIYAAEDTYLAKLHSIMTAIEYIGVFSDYRGEVITKYLELADNFPIDSTHNLTSAIFDQRDRDPDRFQELKSLYENYGYPSIPNGSQDRKPFEKHRRTRYELSHRVDEWPIFVVRNPNEALRRMTLEKYGHQAFRARWENQLIDLGEQEYEPLTQHPIQLTDDLSLSVLGRRVYSGEQRNWILEEISATLLNGQTPNPQRKLAFPMEQAIPHARFQKGFSEYFDQEHNIFFGLYHTQSQEELGRLSSILEYHRPPISVEQLEKISARISQIRRALHVLYTRRIEERGYHIPVTDPFLKSRGYQSILFQQDQESGNIKTGIALSKQTFELMLDKDYRIQPGTDTKTFASLQDQVWLEIFVLAHLRKIMCPDEDELTRELVKPEKQIEILRRQRFYRGQYLRWMRTPLQNKDGTTRRDSNGEIRFPHFTTEADELFKKSTMPDDQIEKIYGLEVINRKRALEGKGGTAATGWWTYVKPTIRNADLVSQPIRIAFKNIEEIHDLFPEDQASEAELDRLRNDALSFVASFAVA